MNDLYLSLGSNIDPREFYIRQAIEKLNDEFGFYSMISSFYESSPVDDTDQDRFLNLCVYYRSVLPPASVLSLVKRIENVIGRVKDPNRLKGPRIIDIDIIFYGDYQVETKDLVIPHSSFKERNFVLLPLLEILDDNVHNGFDLLGMVKDNSDLGTENEQIVIKKWGFK